MLTRLEAWIRRRLRSYLWRQWRNGHNRFKELRRRGVSKFHAAVAGPQQPRSLAAAFFDPVHGGTDLLGESLEKLEGKDRKGGLIAQVDAVYGSCFDDARTMRVIPGRPGIRTMTTLLRRS